MAGNAEGNEAVYGRFQGAKWRHRVFAVVAMGLVAAAAYSWLRHAPSFDQVAVTVLVMVTVLSVAE